MEDRDAEHSQTTLQVPPRPPTSSLPPAPPLATVAEEPLHISRDGHRPPPKEYRSSTSAQRNADAALDAKDEEVSLEGADWDRFCHHSGTLCASRLNRLCQGSVPASALHKSYSGLLRHNSFPGGLGGGGVLDGSSVGDVGDLRFCR